MQTLLIGFIVYFIIIGLISLASYLTTQKKNAGYSQTILADRSINYVLTAFSAHASDMSDWLFMAFPAALYSGGMINAWIAIGLVAGMTIVWKYIAPQLRIATEKYHAMTLSTYFEHRFNDTSGTIRLLSALTCLLFFAVYIAAGLKGFGFIAESVFGLSYTTGLIIALICVISYIILGGYKALAWIDCFQAIFLLIIIFYVPFTALSYIGGFDAIKAAANSKNISLSLLPQSWTQIINTLLMSLSWAVGYLGTPHILTKFMGMKNVTEMTKARYIGLSWQVSVLMAAGLVGLIGIAFFPYTLANKELVFVEMVKHIFSPLHGGFILSAIAGATLSVMTAQILVLVSVFTEDIYRTLCSKNASEKELLWVYRLSIIIIACASFFVSLNKTQSIQLLVHYAWMGFGCSFGPLVLLALHTTYINKYGAYASIITGTLIAALWHHMGYFYLLTHYGLDIPAVLPGFMINIASAYGITWVTKK